jgi:hypothetical protein
MKALLRLEEEEENAAQRGLAQGAAAPVVGGSSFRVQGREDIGSSGDKRVGVFGNEGEGEDEETDEMGSEELRHRVHQVESQLAGTQEHLSTVVEQMGQLHEQQARADVHQARAEEQQEQARAGMAGERDDERDERDEGGESGERARAEREDAGGGRAGMDGEGGHGGEGGGQIDDEALSEISEQLASQVF